MASIQVRKETNRLIIDFYVNGHRCREQTALPDTPANRKKLEKILERIELEMKLGTFDYANFFPGSKMAVKFAGSVAVSGVASPALNSGVVGIPVPQTQTTIAASVAAVGQPVAARPTFKEFAEDWQAENQVQWRRSYQRTVRDIVTKHMLPPFGERDVSTLSREEILKFRSELAKVKGRKKETLSARRINAVMNVLSLILNEAADRYKFTTPFYNIKRLKQSKSDVEPFTLAEVQTIIGTVREDFRDYYTVRFFTGMRTGEVDGLQWRYVDFERRLIYVRETIVQGMEGEDTKTIESVRDIQMSQPVFEALLRQKARTWNFKKYVFCNGEALWPGKGGVVSHLWRTKQLEYTWLRSLMGRYADFAAVTVDALRYACELLELECGDAHVGALMEAYRQLATFAEVQTVLPALAGRKRAILSNGSPGMLDAVVRYSGLDKEFDAVLSVDAIKRYKPDPRVYQLAVDALGIATNRIGFVSSNGWDIAGAASFGFETFWINRTGATVDQLGIGPGHIMTTLSDLPELLR